MFLGITLHYDHKNMFINLILFIYLFLIHNFYVSSHTKYFELTIPHIKVNIETLNLTQINLIYTFNL